jgi:hypothetical protein
MKKTFTLLASLFIAATSFSQIYYDFTSAYPVVTTANVTADSLKVFNNNGTTVIRTSTSPSTGTGTYTGASGGNNAQAAVKTGGFDPATTTYFETTITPTATTSAVLTGISFGARSTSTGPIAVSIRSSVDAFATDLTTFTIPNNATWAFYSSPISATGLTGQPVVLRIYTFNGSGSAGSNTANFRIDDLTINPATNLPLSLTAFAASFNGTASQLKWTSANEINVKGFSVEKSLNGIDFSEIAFIKGQNSSQLNSYSFSDVDVKTGVNYYRLKIINNDGSVKYSNTIVISNRQSLQTTVFPNPVISNVTINHGKAFAGAVLRVFTIDGKLVRTTPVQIGAVQTTLSASQLLKGNYLLIYENNGEKSSVQFTKQ